MKCPIFRVKNKKIRFKCHAHLAQGMIKVKMLCMIVFKKHIGIQLLWIRIIMYNTHQFSSVSQSLSLTSGIGNLSLVLASVGRPL